MNFSAGLSGNRHMWLLGAQNRHIWCVVKANSKLRIYALSENLPVYVAVNGCLAACYHGKSQRTRPLAILSYSSAYPILLDPITSFRTDFNVRINSLTDFITTFEIDPRSRSCHHGRTTSHASYRARCLIAMSYAWRFRHSVHGNRTMYRIS